MDRGGRFFEAEVAIHPEHDSLAIPSGRARNGVPTGVQRVGRSYDDVTVFRVGHAIEAADPWYTSPGNRPQL